MAVKKRKPKPKRTLSPEQLAKMQEGRRKAQEAREKEAEEQKRYHERVEMLAELERDLAKGKRQSRSLYTPKRRHHRSSGR